MAPVARFILKETAGFMHVQVGRDGRTVYVNDEEQMALFRVDLATGRADPLVVGRNLRGYWVDETEDRVYVADAGWVRDVRLSTGERLAETDLRGTWPTHPSWEKMRLVGGATGVYATRYLGGDVVRLDLGSLAVRARAHLVRGVRDLALDPARGLLYVAGYADGTLFSLDAESLEVRARLRAGRRMRQLELDPLGGAMLGTSAVGGFRVDVDRWLASSPSPDRR
jgi:hypothetical protein